MNSVTPYPYKLMPLKEVRLFNQLFRKDPGLVFELGKDRFTFQFEPDDNGSKINTPLTAHIRLNNSIGFELYPEEKLLQMMLKDIVSEEDFKTLSPELRGVAMESSLERLLDRIDHLSGAHSTIHQLSVNYEKKQSQIQIFFSLIRIKDAMYSRGYLSTNETGLQWISSRITRLAAKPSHQFSHLPVTGYIEVAAAELTRSEIDSLEPNDIVLANDKCAWEDRVLHIRISPELAFAGNKVDPDRILIQEVINSNRKRDTMSNMKPAKANSQELPVDDIPIQLVFEIGRTDITMGELKHLQPGYTIQLDESISFYKPVSIKANGVIVGNGEIVLIGEQLGIRILEFNKDLDNTN